MHYEANFEMFDKAAEEIANAVYAEALKLTNPHALWEVKHNRRDKSGKEINSHWPEYDPFDKAMQSGDYIKAREAIKPIFTKLDKNYKGLSNFAAISSKLDAITDPTVL
jgi:hypothetical protein